MKWVKSLPETHLGDIMAYNDRSLMWFLIGPNGHEMGWHGFLMGKGHDLTMANVVQMDDGWQSLVVSMLDVKPKDYVEFYCPHMEAHA